ncbi:MAG TPA: hypothetical protein VGL93_00740 [Streptosporangiaceae bacterium]
MSDRQLPPPAQVTAAVALWICTGVLTLAVCVLLLLNAPGATDGGMARGTVPGMAAIVCLCVANRLRYASRSTRGWLTGLGVVMLAGVVPIPFVVAAVVLQYLPASNAWFRAAG